MLCPTVATCSTDILDQHGGLTSPSILLYSLSPHPELLVTATSPSLSSHPRYYHGITPSILSHPQYYHTLTIITPSLLSHPHYYHTLTIITPSLLSHPHYCHTLTIVTPSLLSHPLQSTDKHPHYNTLKELLSSARPLPMKLEQLPQVESRYSAAKGWVDRSSRVFLKKNSNFGLLEVSCYMVGCYGY